MHKKKTRVKYSRKQRETRHNKVIELTKKINEYSVRIQRNEQLLENRDIVSVQRNILRTGIHNMKQDISEMRKEIENLGKKYRKHPVYKTIHTKYGEISGEETIALSNLIGIAQPQSGSIKEQTHSVSDDTLKEQMHSVSEAINILNTQAETPDDSEDIATEIFQTPDTSLRSSSESDMDVVPSQDVVPSRSIIGEALDDLPNDPMFSTLYLIIGRLINITSQCIETVGNVAVGTTKQIFKLLKLMWGFGPVGKIVVLYICSKLYGCETLHTLVPIRETVINLITFMKGSDFIQYICDVIRNDAEKWAGTAASVITNAILYIINRFDLRTTIQIFFRNILTEAIRDNLGTIGNLFNQYVATATANVAANVAEGVASGLAAGATTEAQTIAARHIVDALVKNQDFQNMLITNQAATGATTSFVNGMFGALGNVIVPFAASAIGAAAQPRLTNFGGKYTRKLKRKNQTKRRAL